jgi:replicative DNA helicase
VSIIQQLERVPPQNLEAEQGVLGSMLLDRDAIARVVEAVRAEDFYRDAHRVIFAAMVDLFERGEPVDLITITNRLASMGKIEDVGGATYLASLPNVVPTAANVDYYAGIVLEKSMLRALINAGTHIAALGYEGADDIAALIDHAERLVFGIAARRNIQEFQVIKEILKDSFEKIDKRYQEKGTVTGVPTSFTDLDMMTSGLQSSDMIIVAARPSVGKCVSAGSEIALDDGSITTIEELVRRRHARLLTLSADWTFRWAEPSAFVDDGCKPVFRITTGLGRAIECTAIHPFLTAEGWLPLASLRVGDRIAVPRTLGVFGNVSMRECEIKLLAYFIGDGSPAGGKAVFTNTDPRLVEDFAQAVDAFGTVRCQRGGDAAGRRASSFAVTGDPDFVRKHGEADGRALLTVLGAARGASAGLARPLGVSPANIIAWKRGISVPKRDLFHRLGDVLAVSLAMPAPAGDASIARSSKHPLVLWLAEHELWGKGAAPQEIPRAVFTLPRPQLALFLNRLFATDGWACAMPQHRTAHVGYATVSERLVRQLQHLLLRFGVIAKVRKRSVRDLETQRIFWQLQITEPRSLQTFVRQIGIFGKEDRLEQVLEMVARERRKPSIDAIPVGVGASVAAGTGMESRAGVARRAGLRGVSNIHAGKRALSGERLGALARAMRSDIPRPLGSSDVYWDRIASIEPAGVKHVYDLTVPVTHNFIANDVLVHNTTFSLNIAQHAALQHKIPVAIFSLETSKEQLVQRILCAEAQVDNSKLRTGFLADDDWRKLARAMGVLSEAPIFIDDSATLSVVEMRAKARKLKAEHGLGLIVIDYIQLIQSFRRTENRTQELSEIARNIKSLAKELDVPIIAISQLSRAVEALGQKRPILSHLRESGEIEQVSDLVLFLYREDYYDQEKAQKENKENICEVIIAKHRNGPIGTVELYFHKEHSRFDNLAKHR